MDLARTRVYTDFMCTDVSSDGEREREGERGARTYVCVST